MDISFRIKNMYDEQLFYWPEKHAIIALSIYLDGTFAIRSTDISEQECLELLKECLNQVMEVEDYLFVKGLTFLDHIPTE